MYNRVGVIGNIDSISAFKAVGIEVFDCNTPEQARQTVKELSKENFAVIFIAETLAEKIPDVVSKAKTSPYPVLVPISVNGKGTGFGMNGIKKDVEKAIGMDILFNKEDEKCEEE